MAEIHQLKSDDALGREACAWIACLDASASDDEKRAFEAWRKADPRHERAWALTVMVWRQMVNAGKLTRAVSNSQAFNALTEQAIRRSLRAREKVRRIAMASAAAVAVTAGVAWWVYLRPPPTEFQTAVGEHSRVKLPDGSMVDLNSNSVVRVAYSTKLRMVRLERGEGYFDVQRDSERPFWVVAGKSWVGALGTAFNVDMRATRIRVTVNEGVVKVVPSVPTPTAPAIPQGDVRLSLVKAGEQADVQTAATQVRSLTQDQLTRSLSWRQGSIYFERERLATVVEELNRYTPVKMIVEDVSLRDRQVAGTFETNAQGAEVLLANLQDGLGLKVRRQGNTVYITQE